MRNTMSGLLSNDLQIREGTLSSTGQAFGGHQQPRMLLVDRGEVGKFHLNEALCFHLPSPLPISWTVSGTLAPSHRCFSTLTLERSKLPSRVWAAVENHANLATCMPASLPLGCGECSEDCNSLCVSSARAHTFSIWQPVYAQVSRHTGHRRKCPMWNVLEQQGRLLWLEAAQLLLPICSEFPENRACAAVLTLFFSLYLFVIF